MLTVNRERSERRKHEKNSVLGIKQIIGPRPLGGGARRVRPPGSVSGAGLFIRGRGRTKVS